MKKTFLTLMGLITLITLFTFSSCKKDRTAPEYQTFELVYATTNYMRVLLMKDGVLIQHTYI